ncbi:hypothetical protein SAICODRAFT_7565 [Saitoella complicata NRRL Y-17804]|uniref:uncharacterized protein n=1 Tax=Saitoella complicata (strain BCRC 22490 / CBS 7301 / JCM 7358 / NBRC 10748 / NRRL Y-17804) TaxID=698492 RepID=UPI000866A81D|nr:uncharacterized protein SAICODRAFT_7565 [Saitoella complicata NRRL Y-17804]ODQ52964.1 hypothetical protein SAICODRAFT_7565 [Saitoella complicata NRRL Y-17804]
MAPATAANTKLSPPLSSLSSILTASSHAHAHPNPISFDSTPSTKLDLRKLHSALAANEQKMVQTQKTLEGLFLTSNRLRVGVEVSRGALQGVVPRVRSAVEPYTVRN